MEELYELRRYIEMGDTAAALTLLDEMDESQCVLRSTSMVNSLRQTGSMFVPVRSPAIETLIATGVVEDRKYDQQRAH